MTTGTAAAETLKSTVAEITARIADKPLDADLDRFLNDTFPPGSETFQRLADTCRRGMDEGWLGEREMGGIRFGRPVKPGPETHGFSVDVVRYRDLAGPHHGHPKGEIDMIVPLEPDAKFDGRGEGWLVYEPGTAHHPTISEGEAIVLYLLPEGEIAFTKGK
ncbi:DUF4863 family protein [Marivibrio halodurans]|uniref:DUF4863 family protein n=1 Tax=Marivibrio halodurans TaxID=2039722 RepID=A0A8J7SKM8_9PROT|nr:DUF4863 family protein [Marivibrio halodurans]MBP5856308.1 DUF4863 family protein [Marivibrio halodurans]